MTNIIYNKFRRHIADQLLESLTEPANNAYYIVLSKSTAWANDAAPSTPDATEHFADHVYHKEFISGKLVTRSNASYVIRRVNWITGKVYQQYDHMIENIYEKDFYVVTDEHNVYKCIFNNGGALSTSKPVGVSESPITLSDGYTWKYMYSITSDEAEKFLTQDFMPVKYLTSDDNSRQYDVQEAAINGSLDAIEVTATGSNYRAYNEGAVTRIVNATAVQIATTANTSQDDHYKDSAFYVRSGVGAGQVKVITNYDAASRTVTVANAFSPALSSGGLTPSLYKISPQVKITSPDGTGAVAISTIDKTANTVANVVMIAVGSGYTRANVSIISKNEHGSGATGRVLISPKGGHGNNAVRELGAEKLMLNTRFVGTESNTVPDAVTFRQVALIKDPLFANGTQANTTSRVNVEFSTRLRHNVSGSSKFVVNEFVAGETSGAEGRVVQSNTSTVVLTAVDGIFIGNERLLGNTTSSFIPTIDGNGVLASDMINSSGELLYVQNVKPVTRDKEQIEDIKIVLDF
jgi:hypothetical protein